MPGPDDDSDVFTRLHRDIDARDKLGQQRYGKPLTTFDTRDTLQDAYEEALDLAVYLLKALMERDARIGKTHGR